MKKKSNLIQEKSPLRNLREEKGWTRPEVKSFIGVSERMQADWEDGTSIPSAKNLLALAKLYKISLKTIFTICGFDVTGVPDDHN